MSARSQRRLIATLAAHEKWAKLDPAGRRQATAAARRAAEDRWLKLAREHNPQATEPELARIADSLKSANFARMALKSAQVRQVQARQGKPAKTLSKPAKAPISVRRKGSAWLARCRMCRSKIVVRAITQQAAIQAGLWHLEHSHSTKNARAFLRKVGAA